LAFDIRAKVRLHGPRVQRAFWLVAWLAATACIGERPRRCETQGDCAIDGAVCSTRGFCQRECEQDGDCPCGSYCAVGCGMCISVDNQGAATCFASDNGLDVRQLVGACGRFLEDRSAGQQDGGVCAPPAVPLQCTARIATRVPDAGEEGAP
jgi:hypothetical protein